MIIIIYFVLIYVLHIFTLIKFLSCNFSKNIFFYKLSIYFIVKNETVTLQAFLGSATVSTRPDDQFPVKGTM